MRFSITIFSVGEWVGLEAHIGGDHSPYIPLARMAIDQIGSEM